MKLVAQPRIILTDEEKKVLREASDIIKEIVDVLRNNKENGFAAYQEGLSISGCFWEIYYDCRKIENDELIP